MQIGIHKNTPYSCIEIEVDNTKITTGLLNDEEVLPYITELISAAEDLLFIHPHLDEGDKAKRLAEIREELPA